jgi:hypothetical protein
MAHHSTAMPSHEKNSTELEQVEHVRTEDADNFQTEEDALPAGYFRSCRVLSASDTSYLLLLAQFSRVIHAVLVLAL